MTALKQLVKNIQSQLFDSIVSHRLVYNSCWEDPRIDRKLLDLDSDSKVVMLTSAGCNALDYLLDDPAVIFSVDPNPNQNGLLELKQALFSNGSHELLFKFFGRGRHPAAQTVYQQVLRPQITGNTRQLWDEKINYFTSTSGQSSFYFRGTSGKIAHMMHRHLKRKGLYAKTLNLLNATSLQEQKYYFREIESGLWDGFVRWLLKRSSTMKLLGVPKTQRNLIEQELEGGIYQFIRSSLEHVFTELPVGDNYFWRVYIIGSYTASCCPNYLKEINFDTLQKRIERIQTYTTTLSDFLEKHPGSYSHFVLLDHQDWMANRHPAELHREWKLILDNAVPGARILFRSACREVTFLPDFVHDNVNFDSNLTNRLHRQDRVGTYGSTHLGIVKS